MSFEELWRKRVELGLNPYCSDFDLAKFFWDAAKEDSKVLVSSRFVETYHGGVDFSYWDLCNLPYGVKRWHFPSKSTAEKWAVDNGYRVK